MKKVFENTDFVVVDKESGVDFHGEVGLLTQLRISEEELHGVHRLDKETSGLILFAKTKEIQAELSQLFSNRLVTKFYMAISDKKPKKKMGMIKGDLEKGRGGSYYLKSTQKNPSITSFISCSVPSLSKKIFLLKPKTGKTHQLRVVMKSIGAPILGDTRYGGSASDRMYLHAFYLGFKFRDIEYNFYIYPEFGDEFKESDIKDKFKEIWKIEATQKFFKFNILQLKCFE